MFRSSLLSQCSRRCNALAKRSRTLTTSSTLNKPSIHSDIHLKKCGQILASNVLPKQSISPLIDCRRSGYASEANLPKHSRVVLPALSPTMELGTIISWEKKEGDPLHEGDLLAEIETDKATMGFETPDEGFLARILVAAGTKDVPIGKIETDKATMGFETPDEGFLARILVAAGTKDVPIGKPTFRPSRISWTPVIPSKHLAEIETDKATMGFETPDEGFLARILVAAGTKDVPIGKLLCIIVENEADIQAFKDFVDTSDPLKTKPKAEAKPSAPSAPKPIPSAASAPSQPMAAKQTFSASGIGGRLFASPLARRLAAEKGIDLNALSGAGSGPGGRIRGADVMSAPIGISGGPRALEFTDTALTSMRLTIAKRLLQSKQTIPHYYLTVELEIDELLRLRTQLNEMLSKEKMKLSLNDFIIKASSLACIQVPEANSSWMDTFIRQYNSVDVSVAVSTEAGLITPIVFNAHTKGVKEISQDVKQLALKAREGRLQPNEFIGGTFTISNLGMYGINSFSAVINPPQSCILAVGGTQRRLVPVSDGKTRAASFMTVTLSCDHRVVDGAVGAQWLQAFRQYIEKPFSMVL
ncbi:unnamed protein product [Medioppia subpectinata]|uniref:Acetyltransferase component of pyruvate dehydrogenase complex n=1 Tax=Medioppia subpectinata TaxID=1979941 RepID=A0A7R9KCJ3_9ACAR|nr:unnamed protein product [Medioppia subpectinata]CAG2100688.1 unnamed protein product [Medioppia subpectinata]